MSRTHKDMMKIINFYVILQILFNRVFGNDKYKWEPYNSENDNLDINLSTNIDLTTHNVTLNFKCNSNTRDLATDFCTSNGIATGQNCIITVDTHLQQKIASHCSNYIEKYGHQSIEKYLEQLQWIILDKSKYFNISTLKFPFDLWMYQELIVKEQPTVLIEIGNFHGGSTLWFAHLFDALQLPTRIIAVDIDHSNIAKKSRQHPRITWIESDAVMAFEQVKRLVSAKHDRVMIVEDASHTYIATLNILKLYGTLVHKNGWMIIEDTVLHNGIKNELFADSGAYGSVQTFISDPKYKCIWQVQRSMERFVLTWNPQGYLQKVMHDDFACDEGKNFVDLAEKDAKQLLPPAQDDENGVGIPASKLYEYYKQWHNQPLDYTRFYDALNEHDLYYPTKILFGALDEATNKLVEYAFSPVNDNPTQQDDADDRVIGTSKYIIRENSQEACKHAMNGVLLNGCEYLLMAKSFSSLEKYNLNTYVPMYPYEMDTPLHVHPSEIKNPLANNPLNIYEKGAVARQIKSVGVSVVNNMLHQSKLKHLRNVIVNRPEFKQYLNPMSTLSETSRYLDPLCESKSNSCKIWDEQFLDLIEDKFVLQEVENVLGEDVLIDSTTLSIQWPGHAPFGPHIDRPFLNPSNNGDAWPYSTKNMKFPSKDYPLSVQVLWLLDNFTASNGAFYYIPRGFNNYDGGRKYPRYQESVYPGEFPHQSDQDKIEPQLVTGMAGSAIFAHGTAWHGAAANFFPRPRIALLVQYVPRFIRPGRRFPYMMLPHTRKNSKRLKSLLDIQSISKEYDQIEFSHNENTYSINYAKRNFKNLYSRAFKYIKQLTQKSDEECHTLAKVVEDEAIERALLSYDICHAPIYSGGKNLVTGEYYDESNNVDTEGMDDTCSCNSNSNNAIKNEEKHRIMIADDDQKRIINNRKFPFPQIAFGFGSVTASLQGDEILTLLYNVLKLGIRHVDLAEMYQNQQIIGKLFGAMWGASFHNNANSISQKKLNALKDIKREDVYITSKIWSTNLAPKNVRQTIELTLKDLQISYLDLWLIHWPVPLAHTGVDGPKNGHAYPLDDQGNIVYASGYSICDTWSEMESVYKDGLVKNLGVSNFPISMLHELLNCYKIVRPTVNQVESHPYLPQHMMSQYANANNIVLQAHSPLGGLVNNNGNDTVENVLTRELLVDPLIVELSKKYHKTPGQILLRWNRQRGWGVVSTTRKLERVQELLEVINDTFQLMEIDMNRINNEITKRTRYMRPGPFSFLWE